VGSTAISPAVLTGTGISSFLDAMLGEMKERDTSTNAEVMRLRSEGQAKNSMR
jgi:hypothetical protein